MACGLAWLGLFRRATQIMAATGSRWCEGGTERPTLRALKGRYSRGALARGAAHRNRALSGLWAYGVTIPRAAPWAMESRRFAATAAIGRPLIYLSRKQDDLFSWTVNKMCSRLQAKESPSLTKRAGRGLEAVAFVGRRQRFDKLEGLGAVSRRGGRGSGSGGQRPGGLAP